MVSLSKLIQFEKKIEAWLQTDFHSKPGVQSSVRTPHQSQIEKSIPNTTPLGLPNQTGFFRESPGA